MTAASESPTLARRRGRPQRLPEDLSPIGARRPHCDPRVAWLLTTNRLLGHDPELARRSAFIRALAERGVIAEATRISRWESGTSPLPRSAAVAYELALGLPEGYLTAVVAGMRRAFDGDAGSTTGRRDLDSRAVVLSDLDLETLLDHTESGAATGAHWLRLGAQLSRYERTYLRQTEWANLCGRLITELGSAVGLGYVRRYEAAAYLIRNANAQPHLTRALGQFVTHPDTQVIAPVLNLLAEVRHESAGRLVVRMTDSENPHLRKAALSVAATKVHRGHFDGGMLGRLESHALGSLRRGESLDARLDSFDLAVQLPDESWSRISDKLRSKRAFSLVNQARNGGELVPSAHAAAVVGDLATAAQAETPSHGPHELDMMLRRLLRESLLHAHKPRRHHAAMLLAASPYSPAVARQCRELARHPNDLLAARAWTVLMRVGAHSDCADVVHSALAESRTSIRARALVTVGLTPGELAEPDAEQISAGVTAESRLLEQQAGLFALGMSGSDQIKDLTEHPFEPIGRGAEWWLQQGPAIHDPDI